MTTEDKFQGVAFMAILLGAAGADGSIIFAAVMTALAGVLVWLSYRV